ncbi:MAG: condensation domain-containing protein [bacterium]
MERDLGTGELFWWRLGLSSAANLIWTVSVQGRLSLQTLEQALRLAQQRHPLLSVRVDSAGGRARFVRDGSLRVPVRVLQGSEPDRWVRETELELNVPIPASNHPLLRVVLIEGRDATDLVFTFHHCITDGPSSACVVRDVLSDYHRLSTRERFEVPAAGLPPAFDTCIERKYLRFGRTKSLLVFFRQRLGRIASRERQLPAESRGENQGVWLRFLPGSLSPEETQALLGKCRARGTTLFGAVGAAYLEAISRHVRLSGNEHIGLQSSVGVRSFLDPPLPDDVCCFAASGVPTMHRPGEAADLWDLAADVKTKVADAISRGEMFYPGLLLRRMAFRIHRSQDSFVRALRKPRIFNHITNDGVVRVPPGFGDLKVLDMTTAASVQARQTGVITLAMSTFNGRAGLHFFYVTPLVGDALGQAIARDTFDVLRKQLSR